MSMRLLNIGIVVFILLFVGGCARRSSIPARRPIDEPANARSEAELEAMSRVIREHAARKGKEDAAQDLADGKFIIKSYGYPFPKTSYYRRVLLRDYGVKLENRGCAILGDYTEPYTNAYNKISKEAIRKKFGADVFTRAEEETERLMEHESRDPFPKRALTKE